MVGMMVPTVHLNGTGQETLLREVAEARFALGEALSRLCAMTVHGRDYYVQDMEGQHGSSFIRAWKEHEARLSAIQSVLDDLEIYEEKIHDQGHPFERKEV